MQVENSIAHQDAAAFPVPAPADIPCCAVIRGAVQCAGYGFLASEGAIVGHNEMTPCPACNTVLFLANAKNQASAPAGAAGSDMATEQIWLDALRVAHRENPGGVHAALEEVGEVQVRVLGPDRSAALVRTYNAPYQLSETELDDAAVDAIALSMKVKMARNRAKGRAGWNEGDTCPADFLSKELREHVEKGDPLDVAIYAMMLHLRGEVISPADCATHASTQNDPV